ncbi:MAG: hypothetical protein LBL82_01470 [Oscillospiraceae bacterium]|nr:hypothetical protein [Oscillospiraceae bacterium]
MALYLEQKHLSGGDTFDVADRMRNPVWRGVGSLYAQDNIIEIYTNTGVKAASIRRRGSLLGGTKFDITISGTLFETVKKSGSLSGTSYELSRSGWSLKGDFTTLSYRILTSHGGVVMTHEKQWFNWGDAFVMEFARREDELMCLCIAIAIDASAGVMLGTPIKSPV